jgi:NAD(P)-dependent dehydrogenase (short-subunit alcohol dehydrogenase family)
MNKPGRDTSQKQVVLITGATGVIGRAMAGAIAANPGYEVVLAARDQAKAEQAVREFSHTNGGPAVRYELADLARKSEIQTLAARWQGPLHVLVNNAVAAPRKRQETPEGIEMQFAANVLGYFWMIQAFKEILERSAMAGQPARIINVASYWAGDLDLDDLEFKQRSYHNGMAYRQSKQADILLTTAFAWRLTPRITVNTCHPGDVNSKLSNELGFGGSESPAQGAATPVWLATAPEVANVSGKFFENRALVHNRFLEQRDIAEKLYQICSKY